jgi:hypothetical protein
MYDLQLLKHRCFAIDTLLPNGFIHSCCFYEKKRIP